MAKPTEQIEAVQQRLSVLEEQFVELRRQVLGIEPRAKDWRKTAGAFPRDEIALEAERAGREWRLREPGA